jgi:hypothetical protein
VGFGAAEVADVDAVPAGSEGQGSVGKMVTEYQQHPN